MARPVKIEVEAELGDTLIKLRAVKSAVDDLSKSHDNLAKKLSGGPYGTGSALAGLIKGFDQVRKVTEDATKGFGDFLSTVGPADGVLSGFGQTISAMAPLLGVFAEGLAAVGVLLLAWPLLVAAVTFVVTALVDALSILVAVLADLTGPMLLLGVMLGGLAFAFVDAFKVADSTGRGFKALQTGVGQLQGEFAHLGRSLAHDFMPYFLQLIHAGSVALTYFNQLAKMPLANAFKSLSTTGVFMFQRFAEQVGATIGPIFRLAIQAAFAPGPVDSVLSHLLHQVKAFLFGGGAATRGAIGNIPVGVKLGPHAVSGALQPFLDWWSRHDFTKQGTTMAGQIINGVTSSKAWGNFKTTIANIASDAGSKAGHAFVGAFESELSGIPGAIAHYIGIGAGNPGGGARSHGGYPGGYHAPSRGYGQNAPRGGRPGTAAGGSLGYGVTRVGETGEERVVSTPQGAYVLPGRPGRRGHGHQAGHITYVINQPAFANGLGLRDFFRASAKAQRVTFARAGGDWMF